MAPSDLQEQLTKYLTDTHAIERQALAQMQAAPGLAGDEQIAAAFSLHRTETEEHETLIRERLNAREASPSIVKDVAGLVSGHGFGLFAALQPDTPGKLVAHAFSYEHMEEGTYDMLGTIATRAGDEATLEVARQIEAQEHAMGDRLENLFDRAVDVSLRDLKTEDIDAQLNAYLADAHAIEAQARQLLDKSVKLAEGTALESIYEQHLVETEQHEQLITARLDARGAEPSKVKDAMLRLGAINWGGFFSAQPDTLAKLAVFSYAFEHLEIASYALLNRVANATGDSETAELSERIIKEETDAARSIRSHFADALDATLAQRGLA